jgi:hypothetical protein
MQRLAVLVLIRSHNRADLLERAQASLNATRRSSVLVRAS